MFEKKVEAGTEVMAQGADGDNFYVVQSGTFDCLKGGKLVCTYEGTGSFGELALLYNCPRAATIVARTDGVLWALDRLTFSRLIISDRQKRAAVSTAMLSKMPVLNYLDQHQIAKLADALRQEEFAAGDTVFQQGEAGSVFYLVEEVRAQRAPLLARLCLSAGVDRPTAALACTWPMRKLPPPPSPPGGLPKCVVRAG